MAQIIKAIGEYKHEQPESTDFGTTATSFRLRPGLRRETSAQGLRLWLRHAKLASFHLMSNPTQFPQELGNYYNILRDEGLSYGDYVERLMPRLRGYSWKMADEQSLAPFNKSVRIVAEVERRLAWW